MDQDQSQEAKGGVISKLEAPKKILINLDFNHKKLSTSEYKVERCDNSVIAITAQ